MSFLIKHIDSLFSMDWQTLAVLAVLCAMAAYFIKDYLANPALIVFVYPVLVLFSILVQYLIMQAELYPPKKLDQWLMWTILASICGTIVGTVLVACIGTLRDRAGSRRAQARAPRKAGA
jgi:membrane associated rhomboid family serine protease